MINPMKKVISQELLYNIYKKYASYSCCKQKWLQFSVIGNSLASMMFCCCIRTSGYMLYDGDDSGPKPTFSAYYKKKS